MDYPPYKRCCCGVNAAYAWLCAATLNGMGDAPSMHARMYVPHGRTSADGNVAVAAAAYAFYYHHADCVPVGVRRRGRAVRSHCAA